MSEEKSYLIDADVLIDYCKSDLSVLEAFSEQIGKLYILTTTLNEVLELDEIICKKLGLPLIEPSENHIEQAVREPITVGFNDYLCLLTAKSENYILLTNDKKLRNLCSEDGITVLWGLEILESLFKFGHLPFDKVKSIAEKIHNTNQFRITDKIIDRFNNKLKNLSRK